jgi:hypothetical protein
MEHINKKVRLNNLWFVFTAAESSDLWREVGKEGENYGRKNE